MNIWAKKGAAKVSKHNPAVSPTTATTAILAAFGTMVVPPAGARAQGRPDIVWMRGGHWAPARSVAYSPDGRFVASGSDDWTLKLWRVSDGMLIRTFRGNTGYVTAVAFSADGQMLAAAGRSYPLDQSPVTLWRVSDGEQLHVIRGHNDVVTAVSFSPDGQTLVSASRDAAVKLWRTADAELVRTLIHARGVESVAWSPDGQTIASGGTIGTIKIWRAADGELLRSLNEHLQIVRSVAFSPGSELLVSGGGDYVPPYDYTVRLWRVADGTLLQTLGGHTELVTSVAFAPDARSVASGSWDKTLRLWRIADGAPIRTIEESDLVFSLGYSPDGESIVSAIENPTAYWFGGILNLWRVSDGGFIRTLTTGHARQVHSLAVSPDGALLATASEDRTARVWDASTAGELLRVSGCERDATAVALSPDGAMLAVGSLDCPPELRRVESGELIRVLEGHTRNTVYAVEFAPDGLAVATAGYDDGTIRLWRVTTGELLWTAGAGRMKTLVFSPDGLTLLSAGDDRSIRLWRVADGQLVRTFAGHAGAVTSIAYAPDGRMFASAGRDETIILWRASDGAPVSIIPLDSYANSIAFSHEGQTLIAVGGAARILRVSDGTVLANYDEEISNAINTVRNLPRSDMFVYGRFDGTLVMARNPFAGNAGCGREARLAVRCKRGGNTVFAKMTQAAPGIPVTFTVDGQHPTRRTTDDKGKTQVKFKRRGPGAHTVRVCNLEKPCWNGQCQCSHTARRRLWVVHRRFARALSRDRCESPYRPPSSHRRRTRRLSSHEHRLPRRTPALRPGQGVNDVSYIVRRQALVGGEVGKVIAQHPGLDGAGRDAEDADAQRTAFVGQADRPRVDPRLARAVGAQAGKGILRRHRRDVDDHPAPLPHEDRPDGLAGDEHGADVDVQHVIQRPHGQRLDAAERGRAGAVDEDVDSA